MKAPLFLMPDVTKFFEVGLHAAVHISEQFKHATGSDVMDATVVMQQDAVYETSADKDEADNRLSRLGQDGHIPRCGMMQYLTDDEDMTLRSAGDLMLQVQVPHPPMNLR